MATTKARMSFVQLKQTIYNGLGTWDANTLYFCTDTNRIYLGTVLMSRPAQVVAELPATGAIQDTVYIRTSDGTIHYHDGSKFVQCYNKKVDDTAIKSVAVSGGTLTTKDFDSNSSSTYINGLVSGVAYKDGKLQITVTENGSTKTVEANVPIDNFLSTVSRKTVEAADLTGADATTVYKDCEAGDVGVLFTMVNGDKTFVKLTDLVDVYEESNSTSSAVTVSIDGYKVSAALKYDNTHFEQDAATGALKIKAARVKEIVAVSNAVENNLVALDASGNSKDSGKKVGGPTISATPDANTVATEAAVAALAATKVAKQTSATEDNVVLFGDDGEVKDGGYRINTTADYEDSNSANDKVLVTEKTLSGIVSKLVAGDMGDALNGKLDNVTAGKAGEIIIATATGSVEVSGKKFGGATLAATANANTVATEIAVKAAIEDAVSWTIMTE